MPQGATSNGSVKRCYFDGWILIQFSSMQKMPRPILLFCFQLVELCTALEGDTTYRVITVVYTD